MADFTKFSSKMDPKVLAGARRLADEADRTLASVLNEAVAEYLERVRVRPAFRKATERVLDRNAELLARLAK
jgi:predicted transcriptional regulator